MRVEGVQEIRVVVEHQDTAQIVVGVRGVVEAVNPLAVSQVVEGKLIQGELGGNLLGRVQIPSHS